MSIELIRNQRDKNSEELYATPTNGKCPIAFELPFFEAPCTRSMALLHYSFLVRYFSKNTKINEIRTKKHGFLTLFNFPPLFSKRVIG